jgi:hypothetical protein
MADYFLCPNCFHPCLIMEGERKECSVCHHEAEKVSDICSTTPMQDDLAEMEQNFKDSLVGSVTLIKGKF